MQECGNPVVLANINQKTVTPLSTNHGSNCLQANKSPNLYNGIGLVVQGRHYHDAITDSFSPRVVSAKLFAFFKRRGDRYKPRAFAVDLGLAASLAV